MKKVISLSMVCLMALSICVVFSCTRDDDESNSGGVSNSGVESNDTYVDLGLPSGTRWKASNEINAVDAEFDFFTFDEALSQFGERLPTKVQFQELINECHWAWMGNEYMVTGPNGNYIVLPAAGFRNCWGGVENVGYSGLYWSSAPNGSDYAWGIFFHRSGSMSVDYYDRCYGISVRLFQD